MAKKEKNNKKTLVLLDAHAIIHRAYHALPGFSSSKGEPTGALYGLVNMILKTVNDIDPDFMVACFDVPEPTYRHEAYEDYKAGRGKADESLIIQLKRAKDVFNAFGIDIYEAPGFEADDVIGTIAKETEKNKDLSVVIASGDMDTLQLVENERVRVLTLRKGINETALYNEKAVYERFGFSPKLLPDFKGLRGDPSDNIPGVRGIGEKTAEKLIKAFGTLENILEKVESDPDLMKKEGIKERIVELLRNNSEEAKFSKMLATIRTDAPIDFSLPQKSWKDKIDSDSVTSMFSELEFRSLVERFRKTVGLEKKKGSKKKEISKDKKRELAVATWLLNSEITQPKEEDITNFFNCHDLSEAYDIAMRSLKDKGLKEVFEKVEKPFIPVIDKMRGHGITIDTEVLRNIKKEYEKELKEEEKKIWKQAGKEFNINSPVQLGEVLFKDLGLSIKNHKKTSTGAKSTKESELVKLKDEHPIVEEILNYREIAKILSTYVDPVLSMVDKNGKLYAEFVQTGTTTGRISSNNPNLQNIPVSSEKGRRIREAFVAMDGHTLVAFDYSQIELRVAALLSGDEKLLSVFNAGGDIHSAVAAEVFGVSEEEIDREMRRKAKVINFGILYGMGVNALKQNLGTSQAEARQFLDKYFERFSTLSSYIEKIKESAHEKGYTTTLYGRRRYVAGLNSPVPYIRAAAERAAVNAPIQGTAADIIKRAAVLINDLLEKEKKSDKAFPIIQVHDELIFEVGDQFLLEFIPSVKRIMESFLEEEGRSSVPFKVDVKTGKSWGKMEKKT
ncbi:MAG: DNA polymerase [Patescibacteria group bacterium]